MIDNGIDIELLSKKPKTYSYLTFTPELIDTLLSMNTNNIPKAKAKISLYSRLMIEGKWKYNGDSIRVSENGVLLDGQNRLIAARNADFRLVSDLIIGLPDEVFSTIDQGRVRQKGQILARDLGITGPEARVLSIAVPKIIKHDNNLSQGTTSGSTSKYTVTVDMINKYIEEHPDIMDDVQYVKSTFGSRSILPMPTILFMYHIGSRYNVEYTQKFLNKLLRSIDLKQNETLHHLNQILIKIKGKSLKWTTAEIDNTLIKSWNSIAKSGLFSIKYYNNVKSRSNESNVQFNMPSMLAVDEMLSS
ncbi:hypothetical protein K6837_004686 [Vibrio parahaemolyticus]|nr:hypothetical protein [Vibrio parahaemolyticus]